MIGARKSFKGCRKYCQHKEKLSSGPESPSALEQVTPGLKTRPPREKTFSNLSFFAYILVRLRLQYKYTGIPASRITKPKALFAG
jgi:hypothetical protein